MKRITTHRMGILALLLMAIYPAKAQLFCLNDIHVQSVQIKSLDSQEIKISYKVRNTGLLQFSLDRMHLTVFFSTDETYQSWDLNAGEITYGSVPVLSPGQSYSGSWTVNIASIATENFDYVLLRAIPSRSTRECPTTNNMANACLAPDLITSTLVINQVTNGGINFSFTVTNIGWNPLDLNEMLFQTYLSADGVLGGGGEVPSGGAIFGLNGPAPTLAHGESYTGSWTANNGSADPVIHTYLIFTTDLVYGSKLQECSIANNSRTLSLGCLLPDADITLLSVDQVSPGGNITYSLTVTNNGWLPLDLNQMGFQCYISQNGINQDSPAGGASFSLNGPVPLLNKGDSHSITFTSGTQVPDLQNYPYLIATLWGSVAECTTSNNTETTAIGCVLPDADIVALIVDNVFNGNITYTLTVTNQGWFPLDLNQMGFQSYVSQDGIGHDSPAGGASFNYNGPVSPLNKGDVHVVTFTSGTQVSNLEDYPFLITNLWGTVTECTLINNIEATPIGCVLADLAMLEIAVTQLIGTSSVEYRYSLTNEGWGVLDLNQLFYQTYFSQDNVFDFGDMPAGGAFFNLNGSIPLLSKGDTYSDTITSSAPGIDIEDYPYLVFRAINAGNITECSISNNTIIELVYAAGTKRTSNVKINQDRLSVFWNNHDQHLHLKGIDLLMNQPYGIYTLDGRIMDSGTIKSEIIRFNPPKPGMYLFSTENKELKGFKFIVQ